MKKLDILGDNGVSVSVLVEWKLRQEDGMQQEPHK